MFHNVLFRPACLDPLSWSHYRFVGQVSSPRYNTTREALLCYLTSAQVMALINHHDKETFEALGRRIYKENEILSEEETLTLRLYGPGTEGPADKDSRVFYALQEARKTKETRSFQALLFHFQQVLRALLT